MAFAFLGGTSLADLQANADAAQAFWASVPTDVGGDDPIAAPSERLHVAQNVPNPFNPTTDIAFDLPRTAQVDLRIYAVDGRLVRILLKESRPAGAHHVTWDGLDDASRRQPSGTYFYRFAVEGGGTVVRKMQLVK